MIPEWLYIVMGESSFPMYMGNDPWAAVLAIYVDKRNPAGQILLGFNETISINLMPRETPWLLCLFVYDLVPIESYIGANEVMCNGCKRLSLIHI